MMLLSSAKAWGYSLLIVCMALTSLGTSSCHPTHHEGGISGKTGPGITLVISQKDREMIPDGLNDLKVYLEQISGKTTSITPAKTNTGFSVELSLNPTMEKVLEIDGYSISSGFNQVKIQAASFHGLRNGIYGLLHHMGCRWFYPGKDWAHIPKTSPFQFPKLQVQEKPSFRIRHIKYQFGTGPMVSNERDLNDWRRRNRLISSYEGFLSHTYSMFCSTDEFSKHPEWFPLQGKERKAYGQLCVSNQEVQQRAISWAKNKLRANPNWEYIAITPNDIPGRYCQCGTCKRLGSGSPTDQSMFLANKVARAIQGEFPGKYVAYYAYLTTGKAPTMKIDPHVLVFVTTAFRAYDSPREAVNAWSALTLNLAIRDYYNLVNFQKEQPSMVTTYLDNNLKFFARKNAWGVISEAGNQWGAEGINYYLATRMLWDVTQNREAVEADYMRTCWGDAAPAMQRYFDRLKEKPVLSDLFMGELNSLMQEADKLAKTEQVKNRIAHQKLYFNWLRMYYEHQSRLAAGEKPMPPLQDIIDYVWRVRKTNMVYTYSHFKRTQVFYDSKKPLPYNREQMAKADNRKYPFSPALNNNERREIAQIFNSGMTPYPPLKLTDEPQTGGKLVPLSSFGSRSSRAIPYSGDHLLIRKQCHLHFSLPASKKVTIPLLVAANASGSYLLSKANSTFSKKGSLASGSGSLVLGMLEKGQYSLEITMNKEMAKLGRKGDIPLTIEVAPSSAGFYRFVQDKIGPYYMYVPKGTKKFIISFQGQGGRLRVFDQQLNEQVNSKSTSPIGKEVLIEVPPGKDCSTWAFYIHEVKEINKLNIRGIPPYLSFSPDPRTLLVPASSKH
ncbi:MAG: DUF4838 domain-containing protein [Bacteroidota bacterium]